MNSPDMNETAHRPIDDGKRPKFDELVDVENLKKMVAANFAATGVPIGIIDAETGQVYAGAGWQKICSDFHRKNKETCRRCIESDIEISGRIQAGDHYAHRCKNGLWDIGIPVFCLEEHIATIFLGQFFYEDEAPDHGFFLAQAHAFGFKLDEYMAALEEVPVFSKEKVANIIEYNKALSGFISNIVSNAMRVMQSSEAKYKQLVDHSPDILYSFSAKEGGFYASKRVEEILGYSPAFLKENPFAWYEAIHPDDVETVDKAIRDHAEGKHFAIQYRIQDADGEWHWFYDRSIDRLAENEDVIIEGLAMDITERVKAEERLESFFSLIPDIVCIADFDGYFRRINPAARKILGYTTEELLSKPFSEFVHPDDREKTADIVRDRLIQNHILINFRNRYICKDGTLKWLEWTAKPVLDEEIIFAIGRDCTRSLEMETALKHSELWMRNIFNSLEEAVLVVSPDRELINVNTATIRMFGYSEEELFENSTAILHVDHDHYIDFGKRIRDAFAQGKPAEFEFVAKRKNGDVFPSEHTVSLLKDDSGEPIGIVSVIRDISERKKAEQALNETLKELERSNAELEQFAYIASHDLQAPLRSIDGFLQLLRLKYGNMLDEQGSQYIERSVNAAHRMQRLISDVLTLSRVKMRGSEFVPTDFNVILERAIEDLDAAIQNTGARISYTEMPSLAVDSAQIQSLFQNLIQNAIKYAGDAPPVVKIGCEVHDGTYQFFVKDNGIGIDPKYHERIFRVFQRLHTRNAYPGTGLGLALCKKIVERHGGSIWLSSEEGAGAVFYFSLPMAANAAPTTGLMINGHT